MKAIFYAILLLIIACNQSILAQKSAELKVNDCADSLPLPIEQALIWQGDSLFKRVIIDDRGKVNLDKLAPGNYEVETFFFYYPSVKEPITLPLTQTVNVCMSEGNADSLIRLYVERNKTFQMYTYGMPVYDDEQLNEVGVAYGVKWRNLGCEPDPFIDKKYNETVRKILAYINGADWERRFWAEVSKRYD